MLLEDLLSQKLISYDEYEVYVLFSSSEMGRNWFDKMMRYTFMDEPSPRNCTGVAFAYTDGRRSIFRNILMIKDRIENLLKETENDNTSNIDDQRE